MDITPLLTQVIKKEISNIERTGEKVRLQSVRKERRMIVLGLGFLLLICLAIFPFISIFCFVVMVAKLSTINRVKMIAELAEEYPDTPIADLIKEDMIK